MDVSVLFFALLCLFFLSVSLNAFLLFRQSKQKAQKPLTLDAQGLLHDLMGRGAVLRIDVLNADDLILRSPKG